MPDLLFEIVSAKVKPYAAVPTLAFNLQITNPVAEEEVYAAALKCQVIIEATKRQYRQEEKEGLVEVFGQPERWEETVKALFWTNITIPVPRFEGKTVVEISVGCCEDHLTAAGKYFYAVKDGLVPLAFLFSGTLFYKGQQGQLQVTQISWEKEAFYQLPTVVWHEMMDSYFPNTQWLPVHNAIFDKLFKLKSLGSYPTFESCLEAMIDQALKKVSY